MTETLILFLLLAFANACIINGLKKAFEFETIPFGVEDNVHAGGFDPNDSMVLGGIHFTVNQWFGAKICRPLFSCVACMASVHSTYVFWPVALSLFPISYAMIGVYLLYVCTVSAMSMIVQNHTI